MFSFSNNTKQTTKRQRHNKLHVVYIYFPTAPPLGNGIHDVVVDPKRQTNIDEYTD
jgi:hypothetical protein